MLISFSTGSTEIPNHLCLTNSNRGGTFQSSQAIAVTRFSLTFLPHPFTV
jgi:hypothetical protein